MASQHHIRFCRCGSSSSPTPADGRLLCPDCGDPVPDPMLLLIARQQRHILERLDRLEQDRGHSSEDEQSAEEIAASPNKLLDPAELAQRLGRSRGWVYDHAAELGAIRVGDGPRPRCLFDPDQVRERLAAGSNGAGKSDTKPTPSRRERQRTASTELLPVKGRAA